MENMQWKATVAVVVIVVSGDCWKKCANIIVCLFICIHLPIHIYILIKCLNILKMHVVEVAKREQIHLWCKF